MSVIEIKHLTKDYGNGRGIFDVSFSVEKGEVFGFLGPNGSGKTTTIRQLMGFSNPQAGSATINGLDCRKSAAKIHESLGYIPGEIAFMENMTGSAFIQFIADYRGLKDLTRAKLLMERFELNPNGKLKKMSKGMKQKVGIVCAFMHDPDVLILDEPTSGLDPLMQNKFIDLVLEEKERGKTILMSSHIFEEVERTCSRLGIIKEGRIVAIDSIEEIKKTKIKKYMITLVDSQSAKHFAKEDLNIEAISDNHVTVIIKNDMKQFIETMNKYPVTNIHEVNQSLEEIFLHFYGGDRS